MRALKQKCERSLALPLDALIRSRQAAEQAYFAAEESFRHSLVEARGKMRKHVKAALPLVPAAQIASVTTAEDTDLLRVTNVTIDCGGGPEYEIAAIYLCQDAFSALVVSQIDVVRDLFGNPFNMPAVEAAWLAWNNGTVTRLAQGIYDERAFDQLPILADALEEAGCTNGDLLAHCRGPGPHVLGCWSVDLILGKT